MKPPRGVVCIRRLILLLTASALAVAAADTMPFSGTWRIDPTKSQYPETASVIELGHGIWRCQGCSYQQDMKADGQDHPVAGPRFDTMSVRVVDDNVVETIGKKASKLIAKWRYTVSADGDHLTLDGTIYFDTPVTSRTEAVRVGPRKPDMHAVTGSWRVSNPGMPGVVYLHAENARELTYAQTADALSVKGSGQLGLSYSAKVDGKDYPVMVRRAANGQILFDSVTLRRIDDRSLEETIKSNGKVITTNVLTVSSDGKTLTIEWRLPSGTSGKDFFDKE